MDDYVPSVYAISEAREADSGSERVGGENCRIKFLSTAVSVLERKSMYSGVPGGGY